jgi:hypothetical protein
MDSQGRGRSVQLIFNMRNTQLAAVFFVSFPCMAQEVPAPHESLPGAPTIYAHHVHLEGSAFPEKQWDLIRAMRTTCAEGMKKPVQLPPPNAVLMKLVADEYYTETHFISFKKTTTTFINAKCELDSKTSEEIEVKHPFGVCQLNPAKKSAVGQCRNDYYGKPRPSKTPNNIQSFGVDKEWGCNKHQWSLGHLHQSVCVQATKEPWRSLTVRGSGELSGLWLSNKIQQMAHEETTSIDIKATKVEKNIQVSRSMLNLAVAQGFSIVEVGPR